jgi:hypothetical protein
MVVHGQEQLPHYFRKKNLKKKPLLLMPPAAEIRERLNIGAYY